ncbi:MAG: choice-of-anchor D domain-containing protein [bacterium]
MAQWKIATPRDTTFIPANRSTLTTANKFALTPGVEMWVQASNTFTEIDGQTTFGIDAAYTYSVNGVHLFPEVLNPPSYDGKSHQYKLMVTTIPLLVVNPFAPIENTYQSNHVYTTHVPCQGNKLQFQIVNDKPGDYATATGGINLLLARWTAGIALETPVVNFPAVLIGTSQSILDSIESYGLDPLQVDSIKIENASVNGDFSFISEHDKRFTLATEQTNEIKIVFSPSVRGLVTAELHIYSHNADPGSRIKVIILSGTGIAPSFGVGPHILDFGKVRVGYPATGYTNVSNGTGNTPLHVTAQSNYKQVLPAPTPLAFNFGFPTPPMIITEGSIGQIRTVFSPSIKAKYEGWLQVRGDNVPPDSVHIFGEGAKPEPVLMPVPKNDTIFFGNVFQGNSSPKIELLKNTGNWTTSVILAELWGPQKAAFSFFPSDTDFIVEPDSSRAFTITFHPNIGSINYNLIHAYLRLHYDDNSIDTVVLVGTEVKPMVTSSNKFYDFGKVRIGLAKKADVTYLTNRSDAVETTPTEYILPSGPFSEVGVVGKMKPLQTLPVTCIFAPKTPGPASAYYYDYSGGRLDSVLLTGIGAVAKSIFNPNPISYGVVPSKTQRKIITTLRDSGDFELVIDSIRIVGDTSFHLAIVPNGLTPAIPPADTLHPDSSIQIEVRYMNNDLTGAVHQATLCVYYHDGSSDCIPLEGIEEAQYLQFAQPSVDFGKVRINTSATKSALYHNGSNKALSVGTETVTPIGGPFSLTKGLPPVNAQLNDSSKVQFLPTSKGIYTGYLHATGGDIRTDSIQLRGIGAAPLPFFSTLELKFGIVPISGSSTLPLTLSDTGDWQAEVVNIELIGNNKDEFSYIKQSVGFTTRDTIEVLKYSTYLVTFKPTKVIVYHSARLRFTFDDGTTQPVELNGLDESPQMVVDLDTINFGKVRIGKPVTPVTINIISTAPKDLSVQSTTLITTAAAGTYVVTDKFTGTVPAPPLAVPSHTLYPLDVLFTPASIGAFSAKYIVSGPDMLGGSDTVFITGIGGAPRPIFSEITLDFGSLFPGFTGARSFTLADSGNMVLKIIAWTIAGPNAGDFTLRTIPSAFDIKEDSTLSFIVDYKASTPYQIQPRTAWILFTLDDSTTLRVDLMAQDIAPLPVDLRTDDAHARLSDYVIPSLRLVNTIPDSLTVLDIQGVITYDPLVVDLDRTGMQLGDELVRLGNWKLTTNASDPVGTITYELKGTGQPLSKAGSLLRLKFRPHTGVKLGSTSPLTNTTVSFPTHLELALQSVDGTVFIDSACGNTHLESGTATANMVDHNMPNPFGKNSGGQTQIPFDIGFDNTPVTIRILDVSGQEVARPVDNVIFAQGRYTTRVDASSLNANGTYFYEFRAGDAKPVYMKMMVSK